MSRWTTYDSNSYRLPPGMERIGYDSDTRRYTFRDQQGALWLGSPGAEFGGEMQQISGPTRRESGGDGEDEPIRLMPGNPVPAPVPDNPTDSNPSKDPSTMSKFSDFLPTSKLTTAAQSDSDSKDKSSSAPTASSSSSTGDPGLSVEKTITTKSSKFRWGLLRSKSTPKAGMQSVVNATIKHSKSDSSERSKGQYQLLASEEHERRDGSEDVDVEEE